jgi:hypothetical protein
MSPIQKSNSTRQVRIALHGLSSRQLIELLANLAWLG